MWGNLGWAWEHNSLTHWIGAGTLNQRRSSDGRGDMHRNGMWGVPKLWSLWEIIQPTQLNLQPLTAAYKANVVAQMPGGNCMQPQLWSAWATIAWSNETIKIKFFPGEFINFTQSLLCNTVWTDRYVCLFFLLSFFSCHRNIFLIKICTLVSYKDTNLPINTALSC